MNFNATILISAISFVIFVFIMNMIFYKPLEKIVNERKNLLDDNADMTKKNNNIAQKLLSDREKMLQDANSKCKDIIEDETKKAKEEKNTKISQAQQKSFNDIEENQKDLKIAYDDTKSALKNDVVSLVDNISQKLFGGKVALNNQDADAVEQAMKEE